MLGIIYGKISTGWGKLVWFSQFSLNCESSCELWPLDWQYKSTKMLQRNFYHEQPFPPTEKFYRIWRFTQCHLNSNSYINLHMLCKYFLVFIQQILHNVWVLTGLQATIRELYKTLNIQKQDKICMPTNMEVFTESVTTVYKCLIIPVLFLFTFDYSIIILE